MKQPKMRLFSEERGLWTSSNIFTRSPDLAAQFETYGALTFREQSPDTTLDSLGPQDRVVFANPFETTQTAALYAACRARAHPFLVVERGALPDSVFLDRTGFLNDSQLYEPALWQPRVGKSISEYSIENDALSSPLEKQRTDGNWDDLVEAIGDRPVCLIALQMPQDQAVLRSAGNAGDYDAFLQIVQDTIEHHGKSIAFLVKPHPRALGHRVTAGIRVEALHIDKLLSLCDSVVTFSSGVGVLGLAKSKPVGVFGRPFYQKGGLCADIHDRDSLAAFANTAGSKVLPTINSAETTAFISHLTQNVYSQVDFLSWPLWPTSRSIAVRFESLRTCKSDGCVQNRPNGSLPTPIHYAAAISRAVKNRVDQMPLGFRYSGFKKS